MPVRRFLLSISSVLETTITLLGYEQFFWFCSLPLIAALLFCGAQHRLAAAILRHWAPLPR